LGWLFAKVILVLLCLSLLGQIWQKGLGHDSLRTLVRLVDVDQEFNIPTAYQALTLASAAGLLFLIARLRKPVDRPESRYWFGLALIFAFLTCDELFRIHERIRGSGTIAASDYLRDVSPMLHYRWLVYGIPFVAVVGLLYVRFVLRLPPRVRALTVGGGLLFVAGALGMEMVGGPVVESVGRGNMTYALIATLEEGMEMSGVAMFLCALATVLRSELQRSTVELRFDFVGTKPGPQGWAVADEDEQPLAA
jgi:hypothetical protein